MYDSAEAAADLRHAAASWSGSFDGRTTFTLPASAALGAVHRWSATFGIDYLLATITDDGDAASFAATVRDLNRDGDDRTALLFAGIDGGDVLHLDALLALDAGDVTAAVAVRTIVQDLAGGTPTLVLTRPAWWNVGPTDVAYAAAAEAGLEQWGDTNVWTYFTEEDENA
jgi:hypothetical protein